MKRLFIISAILFTGMWNLTAQQPCNLEITRSSVTVAEGTVSVGMVIDAQRIEIKCDGSYRLTPYIENGDVRLRLPEVVYAGSQRWKFDRRREHLSGIQEPEAYKVFTKANKRKPETVHYNVTVPYSPWMEDAQVVWEWSMNDCSGESVLLAGHLSGEIEAPRQGLTIEPGLYTDVVFYSPEPETYHDTETNTMMEGKRRHVSADLYVSFPQDVPDIIADYRSNFDELRKADSLMNYIIGNGLASAVEISIHGYASPEGALWRNTNLSRYRAQNLYKYLKGKFDISGLPVSVEWTPVDWESLRELLSKRDFPFADEIIRIIDGTEGDEVRDRIISVVLGRDLYARLVAEVYPRLRRTALRADFTAPGFTPRQALRMFDTRPELLSLREIYSAAELYGPGSYENTEVYLFAARLFPDDFVANNNAAAALLRNGNSREAYPYLVKISGDPRAYSNIGTYYYLEGFPERAKEYFEMAVQAGIPGAEERLRMMEENN